MTFDWKLAIVTFLAAAACQDNGNDLGFLRDGKGGDSGAEAGSSGLGPSTGGSASAGEDAGGDAGSSGAGGSGAIGGMGGTTAGGGMGALAGSGGSAGACTEITTLEACELRSDCYSVFSFPDPTSCACTAEGCCATFARCVPGLYANCEGTQINCTLPTPRCEGDYVIAYMQGCYEGCVRTKDCGVPGCQVPDPPSD